MTIAEVVALWPWLLAGLLLLALILLWRQAGKAAEIEWEHGWMNHLDGLNRLLCRRYHRLHHDHIELPAQGPAILVANHISGLDPLLLFAASRRKLRFLIATEQYNRFGLRWLFHAVGCIPVDRSGRPERAFRDALRALREGEVVALFPHGKIHLDTDPPRRLKGGAARLAQLADCPIYPVRIEGVRAQGKIFRPVFLRARAHLYNRPVLDCHEASPRDCLQRLEPLLAPPGEER
ncbi:MAG: 1-acyl-sn-glycerol-3-phosphate acyltransferase [Gammaproteobacteria bacterium]|nr:1-acyl-sn-glycerol-3-phosphate acyltransferase [Gammaproteobacteria bacterium]